MSQGERKNRVREQTPVRGAFDALQTPNHKVSLLIFLYLFLFWRPVNKKNQLTHIHCDDKVHIFFFFFHLNAWNQLINGRCCPFSPCNACSWSSSFRVDHFCCLFCIFFLLLFFFHWFMFFTVCSFFSILIICFTNLHTNDCIPRPQIYTKFTTHWSQIETEKSSVLIQMSI